MLQWAVLCHIIANLSCMFGTVLGYLWYFSTIVNPAYSCRNSDSQCQKFGHAIQWNCNIRPFSSWTFSVSNHSASKSRNFILQKPTFTWCCGGLESSHETKHLQHIACCDKVRAWHPWSFFENCFSKNSVLNSLLQIFLFYLFYGGWK